MSERPTELLNHGTSEFGSFMHEILEKYEKGELEIYEMLPYYIEHYNDVVKSSFVLNINANFSKDFSDNYYIDGIKYLENFDKNRNQQNKLIDLLLESKNIDQFRAILNTIDNYIPIIGKTIIQINGYKFQTPMDIRTWQNQN